MLCSLRGAYAEIRKAQSSWSSLCGSWGWLLVGTYPFRAAHCHAHMRAAMVFISSFNLPLPPGCSNGVLKYPLLLLCYLLCFWDNTYFMDSWLPPPMWMGGRLEASHEPDVPCRACTWTSLSSALFQGCIVKAINGREM